MTSYQVKFWDVKKIGDTAKGRWRSAGPSPAASTASPSPPARSPTGSSPA